jgi:hypothetical protein
MDMKTNGYLLYKIYLVIVECQIFGLIKIVLSNISSCISGGNQSIYLEPTKLYQWWKPEYLSGRNQDVLVVETRVSIWN